jgi:hypothetical protein
MTLARPGIGHFGMPKWPDATIATFVMMVKCGLGTGLIGIPKLAGSFEGRQAQNGTCDGGYGGC